MTTQQLADPWTHAASMEDFGVQRQLCRTLDGIEILLVRYGPNIFALHNKCTHLGQPLAGSRIMGGQIICPFHGACFDIKTGAAISGPAVSPVPIFPVQLRDGGIFVNVRKHTRTTSGTT
jgi:nitrite reductase/ring-hydroxylating ferredoxin subunit